jgi:hypothetical protein
VIDGCTVLPTEEFQRKDCYIRRPANCPIIVSKAERLGNATKAAPENPNSLRNLDDVADAIKNAVGSGPYWNI